MDILISDKKKYREQHSSQSKMKKSAHLDIKYECLW